MNIYEKLNHAREKFHSLKLEKTGHNKFAGYKYFELGDFLIPALKVFKEVGLTAVVSFDKDLAKMEIIDSSTTEPLQLGVNHIWITSPMGSAALKGCHEVQNIGAVETYQRRYLWVAALEIVEHDAVDSAEPAQGRWGLSAERADIIEKAAHAAITKFKAGNEYGAYEEVCWIDDNEEKLALWAILKEHSALRASIKKQIAAERAAEPKVTA